VNLVDRLRPSPHQPVAQLSQTPVRLLLVVWLMYRPHPVHAFSAQQAFTIDPQQFAQGMGIASVGLDRRTP
jgi:hypothetical protein